MKKIAVMILALLLLLCACGGPTGGQSTNAGDNNPETDAPPSENVEQNTDVVIYEKEGLSISFKNFTDAPAPAIGFYVELHIENTAETDYTVQVQDVSANGIGVPFANAIFSPKVLAGKSVNDHIWITNTEKLGIESPLTKVELKFAIYKGDDLGNPSLSDAITIE